MVLLGALGVMLGALPVHGLIGQTMTRPTSRPLVEGSYTQIRFDGNGTTLDAHGISATLMWNASPLATSPLAAGPSNLVGRTSVGLYGTFTPTQDVSPTVRFSSVGLGALTDVRPFETPLAAVIDPFLSVGAGLLHTNVDRVVGAAPSPLLDGSQTAFTLTPGIGARVLVTPNVALQGDVRDVMTFVGDTRHNVAFGAGLRLAF
jgi:hypothetical protein